MRQLAREDLAPYLPHKLKLYCDHEESVYDLMSVGINHFEIHREFMGMGYIDYNSEECELYKILLHPLSDLTKPITVEGYNDGKDFVPMVKLFEMASGINYFNDPIHDIFDIRQNNPVHFLCFELNRHMGLTFDLDLLSFHLFDDDRHQVETKNQLLLFKMLYKWHFDVHALIDANLAVDLNTLQ